MKGKFDAYVLWPLAEKFQNWIVDRSTARDFTVVGIKIFFEHIDSWAKSLLLRTHHLYQGEHYELTYNVNYKGEVGTGYLGFREKNNFYCHVSDKGSENCR